MQVNGSPQMKKSLETDLKTSFEDLICLCLSKTVACMGVTLFKQFCLQKSNANAKLKECWMILVDAVGNRLSHSIDLVDSAT